MNVIKKAGYPTMDDYRKSEDYRNARSLCLEQHPSCHNCHGEATHIYFVEYNAGNIRGENTRGVWCLCKPCLDRVAKTDKAARPKKK